MVIQWATVIGRPDLAAEETFSKYRICSVHFPDHMTIGYETKAARWGTTLHPAFFLRILAVLKLLRRQRRSLSMSAQRHTNVAAHGGHRHPRILRGVTCMYTISVWNCSLLSHNCAVRLRVFKLLWGCGEYAKDAVAEGKSAVSVSSYAADCICCYYDLLHGST